MSSFKVPVYRDANLGLQKMQPVIFSHGLTGQRLTYSAIYMELASCGYCVICISHDDKSADFTPKAGLYDGNTPMYDEKTKRIQIGIRENEVLSLADEIMSQSFPPSVSEDWSDKKATFSKNLVLMGHSFGGITVLGAAKDCNHAVAIIALDPWFWPR
jgi:predicted dienelactone hydrolase